MEATSGAKQKKFYAIGLSYLKADADIRGRFSIDATKTETLFAQAKTMGFDALIVISTCNRTELYGFAEHPYHLIKLLCDNTHGTLEEFDKVGQVFINNEAVDHVFRVGSGLDSQILGDFEIIGQLKKSTSMAREAGLLNSYLNRLMNTVIQCSKRIKTETKLSSGATSVSFAAVQYILKNVKDIPNKKILLYGTGKIGRDTCENLVKHTDNQFITLINRTREKAEEIAGKFNVVAKKYSDLQKELLQADIVIVATGAQHPTVTKDMLSNEREQLILDLSLPKNVSPDVCTLNNTTTLHLDYLSKLTDRALEERKAEIPLAEEILAELKTEFFTWSKGRKLAPVIKAFKQRLVSYKMAEMDNCRRKMNGNFNEQQAELLTNNLVQKITNQFVGYLKEEANDAETKMEFFEKIFDLDTSKFKDSLHS